MRLCGSTSHTRRGCDDMKEFLKDCYKANENWRRAAYKELVEERGLSVGACVKINGEIVIGHLLMSTQVWDLSQRLTGIP